MQNEFTIKYDEFNEIFICTIEDKEISAEWVVEILTYIAKLHLYEVKHVYSESEFISVLERDLGISINCCFEA